MTDAVLSEQYWLRQRYIQAPGFDGSDARPRVVYKAVRQEEEEACAEEEVEKSNWEEFALLPFHEWSMIQTTRLMRRLPAWSKCCKACTAHLATPSWLWR